MIKLTQLEWGDYDLLINGKHVYAFPFISLYTQFETAAIVRSDLYNFYLHEGNIEEIEPFDIWDDPTIL